MGFSLQWLLLLQDTGSGPHGLGSWGAQASLLHGMWDLSEPGIEPGSPAQAGRFFAAEPPGKPVLSLLGPHSCFPQSITSFADGLPARVVIAPQLATNTSDTFSALGASAQWSLLGPRVQLGRAVAPAPGRALLRAGDICVTQDMGGATSGRGWGGDFGGRRSLLLESERQARCFLVRHRECTLQQFVLCLGWWSRAPLTAASKKGGG